MTSWTSSSRQRPAAASATARSGPPRWTPSSGCARANAVRTRSEARAARPLVTVEVTAYAERRAELLVRPGLSGPDRRRALSDLTDAWLAGLFDDAAGAGSGAALVAVGGYGRQELSPGSDLDVVLLRPTGISDDRAARLADRIWYPIWDSGVRLDHAVRTPAEARRV